MKEGLNPRDSDLHASPPAEALLLSGPVCVTLNLIRHRNAVMTENKEGSVPGKNRSLFPEKCLGSTTIIIVRCPMNHPDEGQPVFPSETSLWVKQGAIISGSEGSLRFATLFSYRKEQNAGYRRPR